MPIQRDHNGFTPTQARIMSILSDGAWHPRRVLIAAIDEQADANLLNGHLFELRKVLKPRGERIDAQFNPDKGRLYKFAVSAPSNG